MPLTFIDIERRKNRRIWVFFIVLMLLYFSIAAVFASIFLPVAVYASSRFWIVIGATTLLVAGLHFWFSAYDTVNTVVRGLNAQPPDPHDDIHKTLMNIMEEMRVVTGNQRKIRCVVIPSFSMNALAVADLKGEAVIGITEGLLSRLTRPQIETVIAHEAHHVLSGDCLETTVAASLFGTYAAAIEKLSDTSRGRAFSSPAFLLAWGLLKLSHLLNLFISREREYRADAAAVRMSRNPIALAETLHLLSRSRRGAGFLGSGLELLCIVNPELSARDEAEGFWPDLLSTHPPIRKRMDILLKMARVSVAELDAKAEQRARRTDSPSAASVPRYYAMDPRQQWEGPFTVAELGMLPWLSPLSWVTTTDQQPVDRAWKQPTINAIFTTRLSEQERTVTDFFCPSCHQPLLLESYEGARIFQCRFCSGTLVENDKLPRIIARTGRERPCSDRVKALARTVVNLNQNRQRERKLKNSARSAIPLLSCPKCGNSMYRGFYSLAHMIEIDRCGYCGLTWFDRDELAMLQCLIENRIVPEVGGPGFMNLRS